METVSEEPAGKKDTLSGCVICRRGESHRE
jgi:hypothetical protein